MNGGGGYIKLFRQLIDWEWYRDTNTFRVFLHLLLIANYEDRVCVGVNVPRGSAVITLPEISSELNLTVQQTRTALAHLKNTGEITVHPYNKFSVVEVRNYEKFQGGRYQQTNQQPNNSQNNRQSTDKSTDKKGCEKPVVDTKNGTAEKSGNRQNNSQSTGRADGNQQTEQQSLNIIKENKEIRNKEINNFKKKEEKEGRAQGQALSEGGSAALHLNLEEAQRKAACGELKVRKRG